MKKDARYWRTLALMVSREQYESFNRQRAEREKKELRKITTSEAIREALLREGYKL